LEREALSSRFERGAHVVPLSNGSFAVFAHDRTGESLIIVDRPEELMIAITSRANMADRKTPSKAPPIEINLDDLFEEAP
jgi:hypothetical protein